MADKVDKYLKTFSIHEKNSSIVKTFKKTILQYKHLENILNLLVVYEFNKNKNSNVKDYSLFKLLLNKIIMKAVLKSNPGGVKTVHNISQVNNYFNSSHPNETLFKQALKACLNLNDKNVGEIVGRLHKDWSNFFKALTKFMNAKDKTGIQCPSYPKPKKISKVFQYSVPLEVSKFSLAKENHGLLGINLETKMVYVQFFNFDKRKPNNNKPSYLNKKINSVTVSLSHGHIYYNVQYHDPLQAMKNKPAVSNVENCILNNKPEKVAGLDIGVNNTASIFINDEDTMSLIFSGSELISYNCHYNKRLAKTAMELACEVTSYKILIDEKGKEYKIPETYSHKGKILQNRRSQIFERRRLFMEDYLHKLSRKTTQYLILNNVTTLVISRNLSFAKNEGSIKMRKANQQKFYQIPFGKMLTLLKAKLEDNDIKVVEINEAYTSKTSALTANVLEVQEKGRKKEKILPTDLNGSRGSKKKGKLNNPLGRGMFKDHVLKKMINADLNAAANHIKVGIKSIKINESLIKYCNPKKIKSNNEFDAFLKLKLKLRLKPIQIVNIQKT